MIDALYSQHRGKMRDLTCFVRGCCRLLDEDLCEGEEIGGDLGGGDHDTQGPDADLHPQAQRAPRHEPHGGARLPSRPCGEYPVHHENLHFLKRSALPSRACTVQ